MPNTANDAETPAQGQEVSTCCEVSGYQSNIVSSSEWSKPTLMPFLKTHIKSPKEIKDLYVVDASWVRRQVAFWETEPWGIDINDLEFPVTLTLITKQVLYLA